jgi:hypothetical protein
MTYLSIEKKLKCDVKNVSNLKPCTPAVIEMWNGRILKSLIDITMHIVSYIDMIHVTWKYKLDTIVSYII